MTNHETAAVDRIPIAHSIVYAVRGMPEVADEYNAERTIAPHEISLTYRAAPDEQLGRVHAYVKGWWMQDGRRVPMDKPVGRHFWGGKFEDWPVWLAEEARLHDPEAAVSVPPPATRADDRAAVLRKAADELGRMDYDTDSHDYGYDTYRDAWNGGVMDGADLLRRLADEEAVVPPPALTEEGRLRMQVEVLQQDAERDQGLAKVGARCMREGHQGLIEGGRLVLEGWRFALSTALDLGTGAPWEAIHERVKELTAAAVSGPCVAGEQQNETPEAEAPTTTKPETDPLTALTAPALLATIKELRDLRAPLIDALTTVHQSMTSCVGDEWAMEWLGEVWSQLPLAVRAAAGDTDAADELAAGVRQDGAQPE